MPLLQSPLIAHAPPVWINVAVAVGGIGVLVPAASQKPAVQMPEQQSL